MDANPSFAVQYEIYNEGLEQWLKLNTTRDLPM
jgi:hypothetical protein